jgi:hypothetical protein
MVVGRNEDAVDMKLKELLLVSTDTGGDRGRNDRRL